MPFDRSFLLLPALASLRLRVYAGRVTTASDISSKHWVTRFLPAASRPYARLMRLDRPIGTWLLLLPCWWGLALGWRAGPAPVDPSTLIWLYALFSVGAVIMRGAGCTINDLWDRDFDRRVARTADRPIASGVISVRQALVFLATQMAAGLLILMQLNQLCLFLGVGVLGLVVTYPLFKRITYWPQFVLGLTFNWGALMGWAATTGTVAATCLLLYGAGILWTLGYDTIYAHQDKQDDERIGIKSSALALRDKTRAWLCTFYGLSVAGLALTGWIAGLDWPFHAGLALAALQLAWQIWQIDIDNPQDCLAKFQSNRLFGIIITIAILAG